MNHKVALGHFKIDTVYGCYTDCPFFSIYFGIYFCFPEHHFVFILYCVMACVSTAAVTKGLIELALMTFYIFILTFTFIFRAFSRRFYPKRLTISTSVMRSETIYRRRLQ